MLPKSKRLNLRTDFKWVSLGKRSETASFKLIYRIGQNKEPLVGIATSAKVFKKAHDRNRARRISSKAVEQIYPSLPKTLNLVIMPKAGVLGTSVDYLVKELSESLNLNR